MKTGNLDRRIRIERPVASSSFNGAGSGSWELFAEAFAQVQDVPPSRSEKISGGVVQVSRPARVRTWFISGVTPAMRVVMGDRIMQIISSPAELGRRDGLEFMVEEFRPAGNPA